MVDLTEARAGSLRDDWAAWDGVGTLKLDGFSYDRMEGSMSVQKRLEWLDCACDAMDVDKDVGPNFDPQPHVQLAKILREQGNRDGAARVLVDRERRQRKAVRDRIWAQNTSPQGLVAWLWMLCLGLRDALFGWVFGYGHRPALALWWVLALILAAGGINHMAFEAGHFAPNSAIVMTSPDWIAAVADPPDDRPALAMWLESAAARDYETFTWWLYGLDLVPPLDALGQEEAWRATPVAFWGNLAFYSRWFFQIAGIVIAAVGAAALTGLVGRRD
ncbi:hypothetical protein [Gymnodinialimonas ulvae]|uniref:hypothetical protein n=1 Tax=Gymnodinialimonas ulvae TaxID=3126504 RepID=UPI0030AB1F48